MPDFGKHPILFAAAIIIAISPANMYADDPQPERPSDQRTVFRESFDAFDASRFSTEIPNEYTQVRDGVLWTHGTPEGIYPPIVAMPIKGHDLEISFRYRQLEDDGWLWFLVGWRRWVRIRRSHAAGQAAARCRSNCRWMPIRSIPITPTDRSGIATRIRRVERTG